MTDAVRAEGLRKRLGSRWVLDGIDFHCGAAETVILLGQNGSGKSTLLRVLAGILEPEAGEVRILGQRGPRARRALGYLPDGVEPLPPLTARELTGLWLALRGGSSQKTLPEALPSRLGVDAVLDRPLPSLSLGQRRRACLLAALAGEPPVLLLDEPTSGLDPAGCALVVALVAERAAAGRATILSTNDGALLEALAETPGLTSARRLRVGGGRCVPETPPAQASGGAPR